MTISTVEISGREKVEGALREAQEKSKQHARPRVRENEIIEICEISCEKCGE